jgi:hypothetical protein
MEHDPVASSRRFPPPWSDEEIAACLEAWAEADEDSSSLAAQRTHQQLMEH